MRKYTVRVAVLFIVFALVAMSLSAQEAREGGAVADFEVVWQVVSEWYVDGSFGGAPWASLRDEYRTKIQQAPDSETAYELLDELISKLDDPATFVVPPWLVPEPQEQQAGEPETEYAGVGIMINEIPGTGVIVVGVFREAPAEGAGVLMGDVIVAADGHRFTEDEGSSEVTERVRGPVGTEVTLTLRDPDGEERDVTITRGRIDLRPSVEARTIQRGVGYIRLPALTIDLVEQASRALPSLLSTNGIVLDLRGIGSGTPEAMAVLAQWFLGPAQIGAVATRDEQHPIPHRPDAIAAYRNHLVVITDNRTSGVAEVLAAVLRDHNRAKIVGETTQGGSQIGRMLELPSGALFHIIIATYVTPRGTVLRADGIKPDVELPLPDLSTIRAGRDPFLDRAIEVIMSGGRV
ncbi:MAG: PDZ domain-containing protein [Spirochaetaceae bacterium]|nr:MAG: PDZ domain-containing protein [Spirochaetaceae bacterium]